MRIVPCLAALVATMLAAGCGGIQAGSDAKDCAQFELFADAKNAMDRVDRRIQNLRPTLTRANAAAQLKALSSKYRSASAEYDALASRIPMGTTARRFPGRC
jgi:hypothetical protein